MADASARVPSSPESAADRRNPPHLHAAGRPNGGIATPDRGARERFVHFLDAADLAAR